MQRIHVLTIDPQNDFAHPNGSLFVPGADADMRRLSVFVDRNLSVIDQIHVTLDSHQTLHIAHPLFWADKDGKSPSAFTQISVQDVESGVWTPRHPGMRGAGLNYVRKLAANNRYKLTIWPVHCRIGSWGHSVVSEFDEVLSRWERGFNRVNYVAKGSNMMTEHYSAIMADVPDDTDASTKLNTGLIDLLAKSPDEGGPSDIFLSGEALSHCLASTVIDTANNFGEENIRKFVLLTDTTSSVPGFEDVGKKFVADLVARGMRTALSTDAL